MGSQVGIELILHHSWFYSHIAFFGVELQNPIQVLGEVQMDRMPNGLARQAGSATSRQDREAVSSGQLDRREGVLRVPGDDDSDRLNLIDTGIRAVKNLRVSIESNFTLNFLFELVFDFLIEAVIIRHVDYLPRLGKPDGTAITNGLSAR